VLTAASETRRSAACDGRPTVYFDGSCPLCRREIAFYRGRPGAADIDWADVSACADDQVAPDLTRRDAMARFHVRDGDGRLHEGAAGFALLWQRLPGLRWLGQLAGLPGIRVVLALGYWLSLRVRPLAQRLARRLEGGHGRR